MSTIIRRNCSLPGSPLAHMRRDSPQPRPHSRRDFAAAPVCVCVFVCLLQVCVGAAGLYSTQYAGAAKIAPAVLFGVLGGVAAVWAAALATFMLSIEPRYVPRCREYSEYPMHTNSTALCDYPWECSQYPVCILKEPLCVSTPSTPCEY